MKKNTVFLLYLLLIVTIGQGCSTNNTTNCCEEKEQNVASFSLKADTLFPAEKINASNVFRQLNGGSSYYRNFGFHFFDKAGAPHLGYMNASKDSLMIISLAENKVYRQQLMKKPYTNVRLSGFVKDSLFHLLLFQREKSGTRVTYYKYSLDDSFRLKRTDSLNITSLLKTEKYVIHTALEIEKVSTYIHPYLVCSYSKTGDKFVNSSNAVLLINTETRSIQEIITHPQSYLTCTYYPVPFVMLLPESNSAFVYAFCKADILYKYSLEQRRTIASGQANFLSERTCFNPGNSENLVYLRKYSLTDENNSNILYCKGRYYLVKRKKREKESDAENCILLEYGKDMQHTRTFLLKEPCSAYMSFSYKEGLAFFSSGQNEIHYYRVPDAKE